MCSRLFWSRPFFPDRYSFGLYQADLDTGKWGGPSSPRPCARDWGKPRKMTMGTVPILDFRGLPPSRAQGHGELGTLQPCRMEAGARP